MQELVREYLNELGKKQKKHRRFRIVTAVFAVMVVAGVIWGLSRAGIATTGEPKCGKEEHQHTDECYSDALNCGQEEGGGHQHTETCYQEESVLVCGQEESEEHQHIDECYQSESVLVCGQEESEGHTHGEECYTKQLSCGKEEHQHEEECYIDKSADVEEESQWTAQYEGVEWKENWGENLVIAARLQLDYKESIDNYTVAEDGSHKGYTRYGQFAGDPYTDWDASFVNFCMYYAGLASSEMFPAEMNTAEWYSKFVEADGGNKIVYLTADKEYEPEAGDIVFFEKENEETERQMGIVSSYNKENHEIKVIEGNSDNQVKENTYDVNNEQISEYLKITDMEEEYKGLDEEPKEATDGNEGEEGTETDKNDAESDGDNKETGENNEDGLAEENEKTEGEETNEEVPEEATVELTTEIDGTVITLSGPESSFEKDKNYSIQAEKIEDEETIATIEEAIDKEAEKQEKKVENYQAFDIKLLVDGEEVQPLGPVSVKFSGQEVVESVEDETTEVNVIHVDENTGETTDMEATATEEKEVVIETEHFSVYVYVNLTDVDIFGKINVTVEHWGEKITTIKGSADASAGTDTVYTNGNTTINTKEINTEIYSTDTIEIPNEYYADVTELSKICNVRTDVNYTANKVWVTNDVSNKGVETWKEGTYQEYDLSSDGTIDNLKEGSIIRFLYTPKKESNTKKTDVVFYDYDISDGYFYNASGGDKNQNSANTRKYLKTAEKGINQETNFSGSGNKLAVGQHASGNRSSWVSTATYNGLYLNRTNGKFSNGLGKIIEGVVGDTLTSENGDLKFNVQAPKSLFAAGTGTTVYNQYKLGFKQNGDTYTLQYVNDGGKQRTGDLTKISTYKYSTGDVCSNLFWPLDGLGRQPGDPDLGGTYGEYKYLEGDGGTHARNDDALTDDKTKNHNWHFGMSYAMEFKVGDYTGPMEFYFRGDDDFWLFIDGIKAVDIGGIHPAVGESIDLRAWMQEKGLLEDKTKNHTLKVFYMERGGFGSCCYMQFILPEAVPITVPEMETTEYSISKAWADNNNPYRPTKVEVTLVQECKDENDNVISSQPTSEKIILPQEDGSWTYKWTGLPKVNGQTQGRYDYTYTAKEMNLPPGYTSMIDPNDSGKLVNALIPVSVTVEKNWINDAGTLEKYRPSEVILRLYSSKDEGKTWEAYRDKEGEHRDVALKASENWSPKTIDNLPEYCEYQLDENTGLYTAKKVFYSVKEMYYGTDGDLHPVDEGGQMAGADGAKYKVSYSAGSSTSQDAPATLTVTNTLLTKFDMVKRGTDAETGNLEGAKFILTPKSDNTDEELLMPEGNKEETEQELPTYDGISTSKGIEWTARTSEKQTEIIPGTYIMKEVEAPAGYTISGVEWVVTVTKIENETGSTIKAVVTLNDENKTPVEPVEVNNDVNGELIFVYAFIDEILYELPSTGGPGTYWYMFGGLLLMTTATLITYRKKRRGVLRS